MEKHDIIPANLPTPYIWIVKVGLAAYEPFTVLQPWYFLRESEMFDCTKKWPLKSFDGQLLAFARRQDCDEIACFQLKNSELQGVVTLNGWSANDYDVKAFYSNFWNWMKSIIDDIAEWSVISDND